MEMQIVFVIFIFTVVNSIKQPASPPVWEYTYQYELFEKIQNTVYYLNSDVTWIREKLKHPKGSCPNFWLRGNSTCYLLPLHWRLEWKKAQTTCERLGGYLAVVDTPVEKNDIKELLDNEMARILHDAVESLWVGGYMFADDDGKWRWVDGNPISADDVALLSAVDARQWRDRCLEWLPTGWSEEDCVVRKHMLCEKEIS
ncbi:C-type lectin domain family 6 member A-like [Dreissena polymorpha]|uniref:C-type lectin domain family 6 member A-like n=1 Tax=Dreissena polymorpha TaxID=45954 RepID=UPI0022640FCA|nr:C-type lectin domain family 6 member A-like [Dreissena polymorpha]